MKFKVSNENKNLSGIYIITNTINKKVYIGSTIKFRQRFIHHNSKLRSNKHENERLQNFVNKYGIHTLTFSILHICEPDKKEEIEQYYMDLYYPNGFNIRLNAESNIGHKFSEKEKERRRNLQSVKDANEKRKKVKDNIRNEIRNLYSTTHLTQKEIAIKYNIGKRLTNKICSEAGIKDRRSLKYKKSLILNDLEIIKQRYDDGEPLDIICKTYNTKDSSLTKILKENNVIISASDTKRKRLKLRKTRNGLTTTQILEVKQMITNKIKPSITMKKYNINYTSYWNIKKGCYGYLYK